MFDEHDDGRRPLTQAEAESRLAPAPVVAVVEGGLDEMKRLRDACLAAGIPARVGCPGNATG